ncbi:MAG: hypothetical protein PVF44_18100, partial [Syntrophobacterales bacterium]
SLPACPIALRRGQDRTRSFVCLVKEEVSSRQERFLNKEFRPKRSGFELPPEGALGVFPSYDSQLE